LNGYGDFEVLNGALSGIDLNQFLTGVDEALTSRAIPSGIGQKYSTKFQDVVGTFQINAGVASLEPFQLKDFDD